MSKKNRKNIVFSDFVNIDLTRAMRSLQARFQREALNEVGLSIQEWRSLLNLARYGDSHLRELARLASLDAAHTGRAALELEKKGLIRRYDDAADSRKKRLAVTKEGHEVVDRVWAKALSLDGAVKAKIGKTRYRALKESLSLILEMQGDEDATQQIAAE